MSDDLELRLTDGRRSGDVHDHELAEDMRTERILVAKEAIALCVVVAMVIIRQLWFV